MIICNQIVENDRKVVQCKQSPETVSKYSIISYKFMQVCDEHTLIAEKTTGLSTTVQSHK